MSSPYATTPVRNPGSQAWPPLPTCGALALALLSKSNRRFSSGIDPSPVRVAYESTSKQCLTNYGCVAKTRRGTQWPFLLGLGGHSKQAGDEGDLPDDVTF